MKLTKELEAEVLKAYHSYWDSYLKGDTETFASLLDDNCHIIGSTMHDIFTDKKSAVEFYTATVNQIAGKVEFRNRKIETLPYGDSIMVNEFCDFYFLGDEEWNFYGHGRMSTLLSKKETGWKIIHQHGSMPDTKAEEGEQLGTEKISQENRELREAIKRRTVELEHKNRELAIETTLERVRAIAMSMNKADDMLLVCETISEQLKTLGTKEIRNIQTAIFNPAKGTYINYEFYQLHDKSLITEVDYTTDKMTSTFASNMQKGAGEFFTESLRGKALHDWFEFQKTTPQFADPYLAEASSLNYYWFSLGPIALGISTYAPLKEEEINLFKRFRNVFELSYRRFLDITKAAAQAKEAQLEASLERMRAAAMGMRKPEELITVCEAMFKELTILGFTNIRNAQVAIKNEEKQGYLICAYSDYEQLFMTEAPYNSSPIVKELYDELEKSHDAFYQKEFAGQKFEEWRKWRLTITAFADPREESATSMCFYLYSIGAGHIGISTFNPITDEQVEIVKRFKTVFELSYQRYTDVAKAEAQAREAQIELALERVRVRAMTMQSSEELNALIGTVFTELIKLDLSLARCVIMIYDPELKFSRWWMANSEAPDDPANFYVQYHEHPPMQAYFDGWKRKELKYTYVLEGTIKRNWDDYLFTETGLKELPGFVIEGMKHPDKVYLNASFNTFGNLTLATLEPLSDSHFDILLRFAKVFDLTYTRFNDIQVAEAQAREAQIEIALERVRSRTMAMQKSNELPTAANLLFQQMQSLGMPAWSAGYCIWDEDRQGITLWMSSEGVIQPSFHMPLTVDPSMMHMRETHERGDSFHVEAVGGEELVEHYRYMRTLPGIGKVLDDIIDAGHPLPSFQIFHCVYFSQGFLLFITYEPVPESHEIFKRFGKVFDQTYTRFLDLQKSEAQAREAQVQLAMERVRARTMAMQHSNELADTSFLMARQVRALGIEAWGCAFNIFDEDQDSSTEWFSNKDGYLPAYKTPRVDMFLRYYEAAQRGEELYVEEFKDEVCAEHYRFLSSIPVLGDALRQLKESGISFPSSQIDHAVFFKYGYLLFITYKPVPEAYDIFKRFAKVFEQTYTRFLDLQKAEAQSRESRIEAALEKVRSRTMAMQHSDELLETSSVLYDQLKELNVPPGGITIGIINEEETAFDLSITGVEGVVINQKLKASIQEPLMYKKAYNAWKQQQKNLSVELAGSDLPEFMVYLKSIGFPVIDNPTIKKLVNSFAFFSHGYISIISLDHISVETMRLLERFAAVFDLTYTRFLDLQKAEAQAREAQIEAALERVRSRSMAMQKSEELKEIIQVVYDQLVHLNILVEHSGFIMDYMERDDMNIWLADSHAIPTQVTIPYFDSPHWNSFNEAKEKGEDFFANLLSFEEKNKFYNDLFKVFPGVPEEAKQYYFSSPGLAISTVLLENVGLYIENFSAIPYTDEENNTLMRFGKVFQQTYTRFLDLQKAEAQTKEAQIEAALERVRSRTLAMQKSDELAETAAVLFRQLILLGIAPNRLYIGIIKDEEGHMEFWVTDEDGTKVNTQFTGDANRNASMKKLYNAWKDQARSLTIDMQGEELTNYFHYLADELKVPFKHVLSQKRRIQSAAYFGKGFIGIASPDPQPEETMNLLERFAAVFNLTYTRFNDLQIAEAHAIQAGEDLIKLQTEKKRAEEALTELRATQTQLIQSEKMASLGELTAGIAHEIQNPLNFVNNFSEVSNELLDEMLDEVTKGNFEEVKAIVDDIKQNLEKINHHGKRADGIVKGMLQHSRSSSGQKEPTDINALADEYLRLAYHGLRAKDKSFNATLKTDYDDTIGKITIIPQDIGRLILNIITNAFYAVTEKKKSAIDKYEPIVSLITKKENGNILLTIKDNGNGIPAKVMDKIFQPFFTTKPTGQGTGLGLSLAYDIVKAHGGEIKVNTRESIGTEFSIHLPSN